MGLLMLDEVDDAVLLFLSAGIAALMVGASSVLLHLCAGRQGGQKSGSRPTPGGAVDTVLEGLSYYKWLSLRARACINVLAVLTGGDRVLNRSVITLILVTGFYGSMEQRAPNVVGNTSRGWARKTAHGLHCSMGWGGLAQPVARSLVAGMTKGDRLFLFRCYADLVRRGGCRTVDMDHSASADTETSDK